MLNVAIINLKNLKENACKVKNKLGNAKLCAVVKADAYGHGAQVVANALYQIADCYAVALVEEGVALRQSSIDKDILVLIPPSRKELQIAIEYRLTLTVENLLQLSQIESECEKLGKIAKVHLKINTGMNRLGIDDLKEVQKLLDFLSKSKNVYLDGAYSHYGMPQDKKLLDSATDKFLLANNLVKSYNNRATCHISASGGFLQGKYFDMVRIGLLLYGYTPYKCDFSVKPIMKVFAPVIKKRQLQAGDSLLYGDYQLPTDKRVSLIRYGYADGLERVKKGLLINNRCMDISAVEESNKEWYAVMTDADRTANEHGTIAYEVLTKCAIRAQKIYTD